MYVVTIFCYCNFSQIKVICVLLVDVASMHIAYMHIKLGILFYGFHSIMDYVNNLYFRKFRKIKQAD